MDHEEDELQMKSPTKATADHEAEAPAPTAEETEQPSTVFSAQGPIPRVVGDETGQLRGVVSSTTMSASERGFGPHVVNVDDDETKQRP